VSSIIYVWVELVAAALQFAAVFSIFLVLAVATGLAPHIAWIQLVPLAVLQFAICLGIQLASAAAGVFVRDLQNVYSVLFQVLFWVTPITYRSSALEKAPAWILDWNPLWYLVQGYRAVVVQGDWLAGSVWLGLSTAALGALALGFLVYRQLAPDIPDFV
jgi:ABC-type polysaccharide/polyol phosphate export permease